jgi:xanthine dehydrogenase YagS FAD-binding subunit
LGAALIAYEAAIATDRRGALPVADFFGDGSDGTLHNRLSDGERILSVAFRPPISGERALYRRVIGRAYAEWPLVEVVARAVIAEGRFAFLRVAAGGVAPVPLRFPGVEAALRGASPAADKIREAAGLAIAGAKPLPQTGYKLQLLRELMIDLLTELAA